MTDTHPISASKLSIVPSSDYQTPSRLAAKLAAMPWPDMRGKRVLDVGCDAGAWCWFADANGAAATLGLDRGRDVRGRGFVDVALENNERAVREGYTRVRFESVNLGREWPVFERFDLILVMSVYHHIFENCGDHLPIWFWLWRQCAADGQVLWEGPVDDRDPVVRANVSGDKRGDYTLQKILAAAGEYFTAEKIGPALHEPTREVWRFRPIAQQRRLTPAHMTSGAGGATAAFEYEGGRRIREIARILGMRPVAGSLNLRAERPFNWDRDYFRA